MSKKKATDGDAIYVRVAGVQWRVYEVVRVKGKWIADPLPESGATHRLFKNRGGEELVHQLQQGDPCAAAARALAEQVRRALYQEVIAERRGSRGRRH